MVKWEKFIEGGVMFLQGSYWGNYTNFPYRVCPYSLVRYWILRRWAELLWADRFCPKCYTPRGQPFASSSSLKGRQRDGLGLIRPLIVLFISHFNKRMLKLMFIFRWGRRPRALGPVLIICQEGILFPGTYSICDKHPIFLIWEIRLWDVLKHGTLWPER